jgi:hypothetical protein
MSDLRGIIAAVGEDGQQRIDNRIADLDVGLTRNVHPPLHAQSPQRRAQTRRTAWAGLD